MSLFLITAPAAEPITLAEAKLHVREELTAQDALITSLIVAARQHLENFTRRAFITQTWRLKLDAFPDTGKVIELPLPPAASVGSIQYVDDGGVTQTWASSKYRIDTESEPARITPAYGESYPSAQKVTGAVIIQFTAGYGGPADVPDALKAAIKLLVGHWYENREGVVTGTIATELPQAIEALAWPYRVLTF